jgi:hypothetical protein
MRALHARMSRRDVSANQLTGTIPSSIGFVCQPNAIFLCPVCGPCTATCYHPWRRTGTCPTLSRIALSMSVPYTCPQWVWKVSIPVTTGRPPGTTWSSSSTLRTRRCEFCGSSAKHCAQTTPRRNLASNKLTGTIPSSFGGKAGALKMLNWLCVCGSPTGSARLHLRSIAGIYPRITSQAPFHRASGTRGCGSCEFAARALRGGPLTSPGPGACRSISSNQITGTVPSTFGHLLMGPADETFLYFSGTVPRL